MSNKESVPVKKARIYFNQAKRVCKILDEMYNLPQIDISRYSFIYNLPDGGRLLINYRYLTNRYVPDVEFRYIILYGGTFKHIMFESNSLKELTNYISTKFFTVLIPENADKSTLVPVKYNLNN